MMSSVEDVLARLYPTRTWGELDDDARLHGVSEEDGIALAEELATELDAATFYVAGGPEDSCDYVYVLCMGRTPCLLQVRDLGVAPPPDSEEWRGPIRELYLRICLSSLAPMAAVQQVALDGDPDGDGGWVIRERPRAGVYDAPLLRRFQRVVAVLPAYDLLSVDFGDISAPPPGYHAGVWTELYGAGFQEPAVANYLFFPQPATMVTTTCSTTR